MHGIAREPVFVVSGNFVPIENFHVVFALFGAKDSIEGTAL